MTPRLLGPSPVPGLLATACLLLLVPATADALSFEELVSCRGAVEEVLWSDRVWPEANPGPKPAFASVMPEAALSGLVRRELAVRAALDEVWGIRLTAGQLQHELDRIASSTRAPRTLERIVRALDGDPWLVAECLVRPALEGEIARARYSHDPAIHGDLRLRAEAELAAAGGLGATSARVLEETLEIGGHPTTEQSGPEHRPVSFATLAAWLGAAGATSVDQLPVRRPGPLQDAEGRLFAVELLEVTGDSTVRVRFGEWPKKAFGSWLAGTVGDSPSKADAVEGPLELPKISGAVGAGDSWTPVRYLPEPRRAHSAVWTGTEMIVFSRQNGHIYDPVTDRWRPMNRVDAPADGWEAVVWTGSELIVWGGGNFPAEFGGGGRYDPVTDTRQRVNDAGAPDPRTLHTAVWTGSEMIVWGGQGATDPLATGGRYHPASDSWLPVSTVGAPIGRAAHHAVWTGSRMVVWGGSTLSGLTDTGGRYDPVADSWTTTSTLGAATPRHSGRSVWTGSEMIVWGGCLNSVCGFPPADGARYDPVADTWTPVTTTDAPIGRWDHNATWTGSELMVWGGCVNHDCSSYTRSGGLYDPGTDSWTATAITGAPSTRARHSAVWAGDEVIVWAGCTSGECQFSLRDGGRFDPVANSWTPIDVDFPIARINHTAVWTGAEMIVWGGWDGFHLRTGGRYSPVLDTWLPMSPSPGGIDARMAHSAVWSGTEMIVFAGSSPSLGTTRSGARYDPTTDSWTATEMTTAPEPRLGHSAAWTGTEMLIWGGCRYSSCTTVLDSGGLYDPATDSWRLTTTTGAPTGRAFFSSAWTGSELFVWGGWDGAGAVAGGGRYLPATDSWQPVAATAAPAARQGAPAVWTGSEVILWGGSDGVTALADGGRYDPATDGWQSILPDPAATARTGHTFEWTPSGAFMWGGCDDATGCWDHRPLADGAVYDPAADSWSPGSSFFSPPARMNARSVWTGAEVILWGGDDGLERDDGGRYLPAPPGHLFSDGFETGGPGLWDLSTP